MNDIDLISSKKECCGCGACANVCPMKAIRMVEDENGFRYPKIDKDKCKKCGLCIKSCAYKKGNNRKSYNETFVAVCKNDKLLQQSASGGIFILVAREIIKRGGVVFGCAMIKEDNKLVPKHIKATNLEDLSMLQGSKYVQSQMDNIYNEVKMELKNDHEVLFSGTPCQIAALYSFLGPHFNDENLFTIDIICHGVPNIKMFNDYIMFLEGKYGKKINNFIFRDKSKGWGLFAKIIFEDKSTKTVPCINSSYYQLFLDSFIYRENCYSCIYANGNRVGNLTIGDFWGIETEHSTFLNQNNIKSKNGVSCVLVNDDKGKKILDLISDEIKYEKSSFDKVSKHNHQLYTPSKKSDKRDIILKIYKNEGYESVDKWYRKNKGFSYYIKSIWYKIPYWLRIKLKK